MILSELEISESDILAEEIAKLATNANETYLEEHVSLDYTSNGWLSYIEIQGKKMHIGKYANNWRDAMISLKDSLDKKKNTD